MLMGVSQSAAADLWRPRGSDITGVGELACESTGLGTEFWWVWKGGLGEFPWLKDPCGGVGESAYGKGLVGGGLSCVLGSTRIDSFKFFLFEQQLPIFFFADGWYKAASFFFSRSDVACSER